MKEKLSGSMPPILFICHFLVTPFLTARAGEIGAIPSTLKSATVYRNGADAPAASPSCRWNSLRNS